MRINNFVHVGSLIICFCLGLIASKLFMTPTEEKEPETPQISYVDPELELIHSSLVEHSPDQSEPIITYYTRDNPRVYNQDPVFISRGVQPQDKLIISNTVRNDFDRRQK